MPPSSKQAGLRRGITPRLKAVQTALTTKVQELRDADEWQRWANVGVQEAALRKDQKH